MRKNKQFPVRLFISIGLIILNFGLSSCSENYTDGDFFFLRNRNADMPVWVRGNIASSVFIIGVHGGPGNSSLMAAVTPYFKGLEEDYAFVYWDQRASGASQGNVGPSDLTYSAFIDDMDKIVKLIHQRYNPTAIILLGASWGGAIAKDYLSSSADAQTLVNAYIDVDGATTYSVVYSASRAWILNEALRYPDSGDWTAASEWYNAHPVLSSPDDLVTHSEWIQKLDISVHDKNNADQIMKNVGIFDLLLSPYDPLAGAQNLSHLQTTIFPIIWDDIMAPRDYSLITLPALFVWGKYDPIVPASVGVGVFDSIGTAAGSKFMIQLDTGHQPYAEDLAGFTGAVTTFINHL